MSVNTWQAPNTWLSSGVNISITESFGGFSEQITTSIIETGSIAIDVTEEFNGFLEAINVKLPVDITINPKNVIRVKAKNNVIRVK